MISAELPAVIDSDDSLGRGVFSDRDRKKMERGERPREIFLPSRGEHTISVDRMMDGRERELAKIGDENARRRDPNRSFYGWAVVKARDAEEKGEKRGRKVVASPKPENPFHADIVLPQQDALDREDQKAHALDLANFAEWQSRP